MIFALLMISSYIIISINFPNKPYYITVHIKLVNRRNIPYIVLEIYYVWDVNCIDINCE